MSYDRSDLIPFAATLNESSLSPPSHVKGINLLVMHGTADTSIHPQHSMMLVRGVMQQQQRQYLPTGFTGSLRRRNTNSSTSGGRVNGGFPTRAGAIRISQLMMPDADLSNSRMDTGVENGSPINHHHQLLHSIYGHISQYLAAECFTSVGDGSNGRGIRTRGRRLRKRRRRWRAGNRDQEKSDNDQQQRGEEHQQRPQSQRSVNNNDVNTGDDRGGRGDRSAGGRYRRHDVDSNQHILESKVTDGLIAIKIKPESPSLNYNNSTSRNGRGNNLTSNLRNLQNTMMSSKIKGNKRQDRVDDEDVEIDDDNEDSDDDYDDGEDKDEESEDDSSDGERDDDE